MGEKAELGTLVTIFKEELSYFLGGWGFHLSRWKRMENEHAGLGCTGERQEPDFLHKRLMISVRHVFKHAT